MVTLNKRTFAKALKERIKEKSLREVAAEAGLDKSTIWRVLNEKPVKTDHFLTLFYYLGYHYQLDEFVIIN